MARGKENKVVVELRPTRNLVDADYLFRSIFYRVRSKGIEKEASQNVSKAQVLFELISQPGGLHDRAWKEVCEQQNLTSGEWQFLTKKMRKIGLIRKDGHTYRPSQVFLRHLQDMTSALHRYYLDRGLRTN